MSIHLDWLRTGSAPRGTPRRRGSPRRLLALGLIAGLAMIQAGCTSGPFSDCGSCNSCGFLRRTTSRVFNRPACSSCGTAVGADSSVEVSAPSTVVGPATTVGPTISTPPSSQSTVPSNVPLPSDGPTYLEKAPSAKPGPNLVPGTGSTSGSGAGRTSYVTRPSTTRTAVRLDGGPAAGRASIARPAQDSSRDVATEATPGEEDNPLDHLPPLGLPGEVTQAATASPAPSASRPEGKAGAGAAARPSGASDDDGVSLLPADASAESEAPAGSGTGIARFAPVDPNLAGGSVPSAAGLAWLAEKGYRTVLDLRPSGEVSTTFIAEAAAKGLRYLTLPVSLESLDDATLARFQFELSAPEARPLFFFDGDGSRAGALWYIRRVTVDRVDPQIARREAEEIGLKNQAAWRSTTAYLDRLEASKAHPAPTRTGAAESPGSQPAAASGAPRDPEGPRTSEADESPDTHREPDSIITSEASVNLRDTAAIPPLIAMPKATSATPASMPPAGSLPFQTSLNWRPLAAMLLTGLSLPLAYWTRTVIPDAIARARASLPAPAPRPRSLPRESGE